MISSLTQFTQMIVAAKVRKGIKWADVVAAAHLIRHLPPSAPSEAGSSCA
jgi:hypothetical protein